MIRAFGAEQGVTPRTVSDQEVLERCLYPMVNEGAKILKEGIAIRASDIDVVWINGYGWPMYTGGPMFWADTVGLAEVAARINALPGNAGRRALGPVPAAQSASPPTVVASTSP